MHYRKTRKQERVSIKQ